MFCKNETSVGAMLATLCEWDWHETEIPGGKHWPIHLCGYVPLCGYATLCEVWDLRETKNPRGKCWATYLCEYVLPNSLGLTLGCTNVEPSGVPSNVDFTVRQTAGTC